MIVERFQPGDVDSLGERLKWAREEAGLGVNELTELAGVSGGLVTKIEKGKSKRPAADTIEKLAEALGVPQSWLLKGDGPNPRVGRRSAANLPSKKPLPTAPKISPANDADDEPLYFTDEVEDLALRLARLPGAPEYTALEMRVAKTFLLKAATMMSPDTTRFDLLAIAAEAAREISSAGATPTFKGVLAVLTSKNRPNYLPPPVEETPLQKMLRQGKEAAIAAGVVPHSPDDAPPVRPNR